MKKYNLIDKYHYHVIDNFRNKNYFSAFHTLYCEGIDLLENIKNESILKNDREYYNSVDLESYSELREILECAEIYINKYKNTILNYR